jgi:hypothetical protein
MDERGAVRDQKIKAGDAKQSQKPRRMRVVRDPTTREIQFVDFVFDEATDQGDQMLDVMPG